MVEQLYVKQLKANLAQLKHDPHSYNIPGNTIPKPQNRIARISHSLPLFIHVFFSVISTFFAFLWFSVLHFTFPVKKSWDYTTSIFYGMGRSVITLQPPSGKWALGLVRCVSGFIHIPSKLKIKIIQETISCPLFYTHFSCPIEHDHALQGEWLYNPKKTSKVILYVHGGAHIFMAPSMYRQVTTKLALACDAHIFVLKYRLVPERKFPYAIIDALHAYQYLLSTHEPENIIVIGDSSGACVCIQMIATLIQLKIKVPSSLVVFSPFIDPDCKSDSWKRLSKGCIIGTLDTAGIIWAMGIMKDNKEYMYPLSIKYTHFPPILIQAGDSEVLLDDSVHLSNHLKRFKGVRCEVQIYRDMFHVFQIMPTKLQSLAIDNVGKFVSKGCKKGVSVTNYPIL